jgi:hypothetical protein
MSDTEPTDGLFPGLSVWDARMAGAITLKDSRLPVYVLASMVMKYGDDWERVTDSYDVPEWYEWTDVRLLVTMMLNLRGEWAKLVLIMADGERRRSHNGLPWWRKKRDRARVRAQLLRCLAMLDGTP